MVYNYTSFEDFQRMRSIPTMARAHVVRRLVQTSDGSGYSADCTAARLALHNWTTWFRNRTVTRPVAQLDRTAWLP